MVCVLMYEIEQINVARRDVKIVEKKRKKKEKKQIIDTKTFMFALNDNAFQMHGWIYKYTNDGMSTLVQKFKNI